MKLLFVIANKYFEDKKSLLKYNIDNINKFYDESLIIVVDNNSDNLWKLKKIFQLSSISYKNVIFLDNDINSKYEIGAFTVGLKYILLNKLNYIYDYFIFLQDNFIVNRKYDFNILKNKNITACTINCYIQDKDHLEIRKKMLDILNLNNNIDKITFCYGNCCILYKDKIEQFFNYIKKLKITTRNESQATERVLARVLWELNNYKNFDIDGSIADLPDAYTVNPFDENRKTYFYKISQGKHP